MEKQLQNLLMSSSRSGDGRRQEPTFPRTNAYGKSAAKYWVALGIIVCVVPMAIKSFGDIFCKPIPKLKHEDKRDRRR